MIRQYGLEKPGRGTIAIDSKTFIQALQVRPE